MGAVHNHVRVLLSRVFAVWIKRTRFPVYATASTRDIHSRSKVAKGPSQLASRRLRHRGVVAVLIGVAVAEVRA